MPDHGAGITVGELREKLVEFTDDTEITFGCTIAGHELRYRKIERYGRFAHIELVEDEESH